MTKLLNAFLWLFGYRVVFVPTKVDPKAAKFVVGDVVRLANGEIRQVREIDRDILVADYLYGFSNGGWSYESGIEGLA